MRSINYLILFTLGAIFACGASLLMCTVWGIGYVYGIYADLRYGRGGDQE